MNIKELYEEACKRNNYKELMEDWVCIFGDLLMEIKDDNPKIIVIIFCLDATKEIFDILFSKIKKIPTKTFVKTDKKYT